MHIYSVTHKPVLDLPDEYRERAVAGVIALLRQPRLSIDIDVPEAERNDDYTVIDRGCQIIRRYLTYYDDDGGEVAFRVGTWRVDRRIDARNPLPDGYLGEVTLPYEIRGGDSGSPGHVALSDRLWAICLLMRVLDMQPDRNMIENRVTSQIHLDLLRQWKPCEFSTHMCLDHEQEWGDRIRHHVMNMPQRRRRRSREVILDANDS